MLYSTHRKGFREEDAAPHLQFLWFPAKAGLSHAYSLKQTDWSLSSFITPVRGEDVSMTHLFKSCVFIENFIDTVSVDKHVQASLHRAIW